MSRIRYLAIAAVVATLAGWLFWPGHEGPQLIARPVSVSYDPDARRLTATVNIQNSGNRAVVASITNDVFVDSRKQPSNDRTQSQPWELELRLKQMNPVTFTLQGQTAADAWNGVRLMEVTIDATYDGSATPNCHFSFMGRFYPQLKQIGTVSSVTSPRGCGDR